MSRAQRIRTKADKKAAPKMIVGGWLQGRGTYLWIGEGEAGRFIGTISGQRLYRLAKAIVRHYESDRP